MTDDLTAISNIAVPPPALGCVEAQLFVTDVAASCDFYAAKLGFAIAFTYGEPVFYAQLTRGAAKLNLRGVLEPVFVGDVREREQLLSASIGLDSAAELRRLYLEYQAAGVDFQQNLKHEPWGARTFVLRDPDGNLLLFAAAAA